MNTVLVADADEGTRRLLRTALRFGGHNVETAPSPGRAASMLRRRHFDAVILDPAETGTADTVTTLRAQTDIPIVVVSNSSDEWDKVVVLDAGADDYLTKPFSPHELLARLRARLRRISQAEVEEAPIITDDFTIERRDRRWIRKDGSELRLTPTEWRLVDMLVRRAGHLVTQEELLQGVWGPKALEKTHYLRVQLAAIRRKVEPEPTCPRYFITVSGLGLRFEPDPGIPKPPCPGHT